MTVSQQHPASVGRTASEAVLRVLFGIFMAFIAVGLVVIPEPGPFASVTALVMILAAWEWHRLVRAPDQRGRDDQQAVLIQTAITGVTIVSAVAALFFRVLPLAFIFLVIGTVVSFEWARRRNDNPVWHATGVLYLGLPALALVGLRILPAQGIWYVMGLFLIVWSTDTGALVFGKLIGGKKLAPRLSPGKTWAGTIGGTVTAVAVFALFIAFFTFQWAAALAFAVGLSIVAHLGDLLESGIKRHFGTKDSGALIPGHGGILDRIDSLLAASVVLALLVFGLHFNPMFGGRV